MKPSEIACPQFDHGCHTPEMTSKNELQTPRSFSLFQLILGRYMPTCLYKMCMAAGDGNPQKMRLITFLVYLSRTYVAFLSLLVLILFIYICTVPRPQDVHQHEGFFFVNDPFPKQCHSLVRCDSHPRMPTARLRMVVSCCGA